MEIRVHADPGAVHASHAEVIIGEYSPRQSRGEYSPIIR